MRDVRRLWSSFAIVVVVLAATSVARAERSATLAVAADRPSPPPHAHEVYVELFGKGGLWGLGYEWRHGRLHVGGVGSYYLLGGDRFLTLSPYAGIVLAGGDQVAWFADVGPQLVHRTTPSPGPEWQGMTSTGLAVEASTGIEVHRGRLGLRGYAMAAIGAHFAPGFGVGAGWSL